MSLDIDQYKSRNGASVLEVLVLFNCSLFLFFLFYLFIYLFFFFFVKCVNHMFKVFFINI